MSLSKPVMKQPRTQQKTPVSTLQRTESADLASSIEEGERNRRTATHRVNSSTVPQMGEADQGMKHPRGHKVRELAEVWKVMDSQDFLHLSDTLTLGDVWVQPTAVLSSKGAFATVSFKQMVAGPHIKFRDASCKMSLDDLTKMLYLNDCVQWDLQRLDHLSFEDWMKEKSSICVKAKGMEEGSDRAKLCHFILTEDRDFSFYPSFLHACNGIFFRKICYHSYKNGEDTLKINNPSMMKCKGTKGTFEYIIEARVFPLPDEWFEYANPCATSMVDRSVPSEVPASQVC